MISRIIFILLAVFSITACVNQNAAPIEYKDGSTTNNLTYSAPKTSQSKIFEEDEVIIRREIKENNIDQKEAGILEEPIDDNIEENSDFITIPDNDKVTYQFTKPIKGIITTNFGDETKNGKSKAIYIEAIEGAAVRSVGSGKVIYAGFDKQFGNLIIVKLDQDDLYAAYANLNDLLLSKDTVVTKGEIIGHIGNSNKDKTTGLYFAIRKGKIAVDPSKYVPLD